MKSKQLLKICNKLKLKSNDDKIKYNIHFFQLVTCVKQ